MARKLVKVKEIRRKENKTDENGKNPYARFTLWESREHWCIKTEKLVFDEEGKDITECSIPKGAEVIAMTQELADGNDTWVFLTSDDAEEYTQREVNRNIDARIENKTVVQRGIAAQGLAKAAAAAGITDVNQLFGS